MRRLLSLLRPIYHLLYHQFAFAYDLVASLVSLGQWRAWVRTVLPYLHGRVLELGFGPGHMQLDLNASGCTSFGVDASAFMARQAARRARQAGAPLRLARALAQSLPFPAACFDFIVATFPAEYIFDPLTLSEVHRLLRPGGQLVILPLAWLTRPDLLARLQARLFDPHEVLPAKLQALFTAHGFETRQATICLPRSKVRLWLLTPR